MRREVVALGTAVISPCRLSPPHFVKSIGSVYHAGSLADFASRFDWPTVIILKWTNKPSRTKAISNAHTAVEAFS